MSEARGGEPTEEPTPRRLERARREGRVALSRDLSGALGFAAGLGVLALGGAALVGGLGAYLRAALGAATGPHPPGSAPTLAAAAGGAALRATAAALGPLVLAVALVAGVAAYLQVGPRLALAPLRPRAERLSPAGALGRILGRRARWELGKSLLRLVVVGWIGAAAVRDRLPALAAAQGADPAHLPELVGGLALSLLARVASALVAFGILDLLWQRREHLRGLRMTREEVQRERKEDEGDPHHKAERRRAHRALAQQASLGEVARATAVLVNPTHLAVALRYDGQAMAAPKVVARGEGLWARGIVEAARRAGVPVVRDVPLARALAELELDQEIPEALFDAVAEVLRVILAGSEPAADEAVAAGGAP